MSQDHAWEYPPELVALLRELRSHEDFNKKSTIVFTHDESGTLTMRGEDVAKVLETEDTVQQFFEALGQPSDGVMQVLSFEPDSDVLAKLEELFEYVEV
jgi:hypothetical protein